MNDTRTKREANESWTWALIKDTKIGGKNTTIYPGETKINIWALKWNMWTKGRETEYTNQKTYSLLTIYKTHGSMDALVPCQWMENGKKYWETEFKRKVKMRNWDTEKNPKKTQKNKKRIRKNSEKI